MAETCERCGAPMRDWSATHCSEDCIFKDIRQSKPVAYVASRPVIRRI
ncbi:MAG: hypothetical protein KGI33_05060 [Thaumarchaeota archaeon]|nr:hypothetical protein [Nitrososphaerota archaeon]